MTINGGAAPTVATFGVVNPASGDVFAQAPACSRGQLDEAMTAAQTAFRTWTADDKERRVVLGEMGDALEAAADRLAPLLTAEQGKPLDDARMEVGGAVAWLRYYADLETLPEIVQDDEHGYVEVVRRPLAVVARSPRGTFRSRWRRGSSRRRCGRATPLSSSRPRSPR
jgi:acyl-CoA reductase-like NAD-dependent aldehyde dehydrogenase